MEILNATRMQTGFTMGLAPSGRESLVVVIKGTFRFPERGETPSLAEEQVPLIEADTFTGEPGLSSPVFESDYAPRKRRCDLLLVGTAHAPRGVPVERVTVSLRVGSFFKSFDVVGNRVWERRRGTTTISRPQPFVAMPISYDNAFGGVDDTDEDPARHDAYRSNPVGRGFHLRPDDSSIEGRPLPNTEQTDQPVTQPHGDYRPMAFGPVGRGWQPRAPLAGTYDEDWQANRFPFLPDDFDERYHQAAPADQQIDYPVGGEEVVLFNLTPEGQTYFRLPQLQLPIEFTRLNRSRETVDAVLDTVLLEPDQRRLVLCWRASVELRRNVFEVPSAVVGRMPNGWYRARETGKSYYRSLDELVSNERSDRV